MNIQVLKNFRQVLADKGRLIISTPSNFDESAKFTEEHVRPGYSKTEIIEKLKQTGFAVKSFQYTYGYWGQLSWKLTMKYPLTLVSKSKAFLLILPFYYLLTYPLALWLMKKDMTTVNQQGTGILVVAE